MYIVSFCTEETVYAMQRMSHTTTITTSQTQSARCEFDPNNKLWLISLNHPYHSHSACRSLHISINSADRMKFIRTWMAGGAAMCEPATAPSTSMSLPRVNYISSLKKLKEITNENPSERHYIHIEISFSRTIISWPEFIMHALRRDGTGV